MAGECVGFSRTLSALLERPAILGVPTHQASRYTPVGSAFERARLLSFGFVLALSCIAVAGCRTAPCPEGTVRDGDVCRRVKADAGTDELAATAAGRTAANGGSAGAGAGAGKAGQSARTGTAPKAGQSGGAGGVTSQDSKDSQDSDADAAGRAASAGSSASASGSGGSEAKAPSSDAPGRKETATAGKPATAQAGTGGGSKASGGAGGAAPAQAGQGGAGSGSSNEEAGSGGSTSEGSAGDSSDEDAAGSGGASGESGEAGRTGSTDNPSDWTCLQVNESCVCVHAGSSAGDLCYEPRPTCCYQLPGPSGNCVCTPEGTSDCLTTGGNPAGMRVGQCPRPR